MRHIPGLSNSAGCVSRSLVLSAEKESSDAEEYVNYIVSYAVPKTMSVQKIMNMTAKDTVLRSIKPNVPRGVWTGPGTIGQ